MGLGAILLIDDGGGPCEIEGAAEAGGGEVYTRSKSSSDGKRSSAVRLGDGIPDRETGGCDFQDEDIAGEGE